MLRGHHHSLTVQLAARSAIDTWRDTLEGFDDDASQVAVPTLLPRGSDSDVLSAEGTQDLLEKMPSERLETVPNAGHLAAGDNPQHLSVVVRSILEEIVEHRTD
ncbi:MAG: alpha/beta fold hydrolase [Acidimicrobiales bacterium]